MQGKTVSVDENLSRISLCLYEHDMNIATVLQRQEED